MKTRIIIIIHIFLCYSFSFAETAEDYNNRGFDLFNKGSYSEAIDTYKKGIEIDSTNVVLHKNIALAYYCNGDFNSVIEECRKCTELSSSSQPFDWAFIHGILAQAYYFKGDYRLAVFHYNHAVEYKVKFTDDFIKQISKYADMYPLIYNIGVPSSDLSENKK